MRDQPTGANLLETARDILRNELMPLLPKEKQYQVLMMANAMSIAARQLQYGEAPERQELVSLAHLLREEVDLGGDAARLHEQLLALNGEFARRVRRGEYDDDAAAKQLLQQMTLQKVRESAPKALKG